MALWAHLPMDAIDSPSLGTITGHVLDVSGLGHDFSVRQWNGGLGNPSVAGPAPSGLGSLVFGPHDLADSGPNQPAHGLLSDDSLGTWGTWMIEAWIRPRVAPALTHSYAIIQNRPGSNTWLWLDAGMHLWTFGSFGSQISVGTVPVGVWSHVALGRGSGGTGTFWINGVPDPAALPGMAALGSGGFAIGVDASDVSNTSFCDKVFDGRIADVKLWDAFTAPVVDFSTAGWSVGVIA